MSMPTSLPPRTSTPPSPTNRNRANSSGSGNGILRKSGSSQCLRRKHFNSTGSLVGTAAAFNDASPSSPPGSLRKGTSFDNMSDSGSIGGGGGGSGRNVTVINREELPNYGSERYYMLSELQLKAHSISFLCDWDAGPSYSSYANHYIDRNNEVNTHHGTGHHQTLHASSQDGSIRTLEISLSDCEDDYQQELLQPRPTRDSSSNSAFQHEVINNISSIAQDAERNRNTISPPTTISSSNASAIPNTKDLELNLPPYMILYLLWKPDSPNFNSSELFADNYIKPCVNRILTAYHASANHHCSSHHMTMNAPLRPTMEEEEEEGVDREKDSGKTKEDTTQTTTTKGNIAISSADSISSSSSSSSNQQNNRSSYPSPHIYIVIDRILPQNHNHNSNANDDNNPHSKQQRQQEQIQLSEQLLRIIATSKQLRHVVAGITVGISTNVRAAPGLELCMDAILVGEAERRQNADSLLRNRRRRRGRAGGVSTIGSSSSRKDGNSSMETTATSQEQDVQTWTMNDPNNSCIALITDHPDDLVGLDPVRETDAVQGMELHLRTWAEWFCKGNIFNFAGRSHELWRRYWNCSVDKSSSTNVRIGSPVPNGEEQGMDGSSNTSFHSSSDETAMDGVTQRFYSELDRFVNTYSVMKKRRKRQKRATNASSYEEEVEGTTSKSLQSKEIRKRADFTSNIFVGVFIVFVGIQTWREYKTQLLDVIEKLGLVAEDFMKRWDNKQEL